MSDYDDLMQKYAGTAAEDLKPLTEQAAQAVGVSDTAAKEQLGLFLAKAWMAGAMAGQDEMVAQAKEQGYNVDVSALKPPPDGAST
jgi:hypothetical protein